MKRTRILVAAVLLAGAAAWVLLAGEPSAEERFDVAGSILSERFRDWRDRVERAARRVAEQARAPAADATARFADAQAVVEDERVDGVALLAGDGRALVWAGRTFDPGSLEYADIRQGIETLRVLDLPAHRVLFAAQPAGGEALALAFLAFDERFPARGDLADEVARAAGLARIDLRFGRRTVLPAPGDEADRPRRDHVVLEGVVAATLVSRSDAERAAAVERCRGERLRALLFAAALLAAWLGWRAARGRLRPGSWALFFAAALLVGALRALLAALALPALPHFGTGWVPAAGDALLTALACFVVAVAAVRAARHRHRRGALAAAAVLGTAAAAVLPRVHGRLVASLVRGDESVVPFDPLRVLPDLPAAALLAAVCLFTAALFLLAHAASLQARRLHRALWPAPFLALALGGVPSIGPWLAVFALLAAAVAASGATRPEKAAAFAFLAAVAALPSLYREERAAFTEEVGARAGALVQRRQRSATLEHLDRVAGRLAARGEIGRLAQALAADQDPDPLAFLLWSAAAWDPAVPCTVQVWSASRTLLSEFEFDAPPARWLPDLTEAPAEGSRTVFGREKGEDLQFHVRDIELRTIGDERLVGFARLAVPDRWDLLLLPTRRPPLFSEPPEVLVEGAPPPRALGELAGDGTPMRSSTGTTADLVVPPEALLKEARQRGHAGALIAHPQGDARLVLAAGRYNFAALLFDESTLQRGGFVFSKVLLVSSAVALLYVLGLLVVRRGRVVLLFRHRVALVLVALSIPPLVLLALHTRRVTEQRHEAAIGERLQRRLDLAQTLLRDRREPVDGAWCAAFAANHGMDLNVYRGADLVATSRPGLWETGLLGRRLAAEPYVALQLEHREAYTGREFFGHAATLRAAYRKVRVPAHPDEPLVLGAPALEDPRALDRRLAEALAFLLAIYLLTATGTVFAALVLARSLTRPVQELREVTGRVAAGDLDARLPEGRQDEFGDLVRAFNRMTRELRDAQDLRARAERMAAWREMARQIAHEIKNPLTPIKLTVQNLLATWQDDRGQMEEEFERGANLILDQIGALHRIADAFSAYASFPSRRVQPIDVRALLEDVAALYAAATEAGEAAVVIEPPAAPLTVRADPDSMRRVLINLVTNARQAAARRIVLRGAAEDAAVRLDVEDDGTGIAPEVLPRLYEPSFTTKTSGTGLGLPIVKRIVDEHRGSIEIESAPGRGTRVTIRLPRAAPGE